MAQRGNVPDPRETQFSCKTIFEIGFGGNWYTQTLPNDNAKLLGQEMPRANLSHTISVTNSFFWTQFWAPAQAQPGRASPSPAPAGPRSGQDLPGRDFPDLRFFAEVGNCPRRSRGGRESAPGGRESTVWGAGRANPSRAGIFPTSANSQRSGKSLPSLNQPDPTICQMVLLSQDPRSQIRPAV